MNSHRPDIVVMVLDCVRASDFPGGVNPVAGTHFLDSLRKECVAFPRSVSASSWTVPSHASLLTGLYPNLHGAFSMTGGSLPQAVRTLPEVLRTNGYSSAIVSANHNLRPGLGFTRGFDRAWWASWGVTALRLGARDELPFTDRGIARVDRLRKHAFEEKVSGLWKLWAMLAIELPRRPWLLDAASRGFQKFRSGQDKFDGRVAPWLAATFSDWLASVPSDVPVFALLNLMDAHEPYLPDPENIKGFADWWSKTRTRQDVGNWVHGRWVPNELELNAIRALYREKIVSLDGRIEELVRGLKMSGRWENTLLIITSDHGQAFGEEGFLFHGGSMGEASIRVPLWVRFPFSRLGGTENRIWTSSVDIMPTALREAGLLEEATTQGIPLGNLNSQTRSNPVFSMSGSRATQNRMEEQDRARMSGVEIAGYFGDFKVRVNLTDGKVQKERVLDGGLVPLAREDLETAEMQLLGKEVSSTAASLTRGLGGYRRIELGHAQNLVETRLRSWGYL